ncbi:DUF7210 family protein [Clostridium tagluense]|uniref:DUF7210 family protein n=1 Tax=Clostridium tagluense TaxID=360422 RepID=UPI001CF1C004|nr:hypothetical protein [Clostridium tagluense]MCB2300390.1 hypothetical protein [Clostridium tagluense]
MAKSTEKEEVKMINCKALVFLKYNENHYKIGEELQVNENDAEEMAEKEYIGPLEVLQLQKVEVPSEIPPGAVEDVPKDGE